MGLSDTKLIRVLLWSHWSTLFLLLASTVPPVAAMVSTESPRVAMCTNATAYTLIPSWSTATFLFARRKNLALHVLIQLILFTLLWISSIYPQDLLLVSKAVCKMV